MTTDRVRRGILYLVSLEPTGQDRDAILALLPVGWEHLSWDQASEAFSAACREHYE